MPGTPKDPDHASKSSRSPRSAWCCECTHARWQRCRTPRTRSPPLGASVIVGQSNLLRTSAVDGQALARLSATLSPHHSQRVILLAQGIVLVRMPVESPSGGQARVSRRFLPCRASLSGHTARHARFHYATVRVPPTSSGHAAYTPRSSIRTRSMVRAGAVRYDCPQFYTAAHPTRSTQYA